MHAISHTQAYMHKSKHALLPAKPSAPIEAFNQFSVQKYAISTWTHFY